jgi:SOS-response transcriptional repressor LexA
MKQFRWVGHRAEGAKCHLGKVPCDSPLEADFANFLDAANDVERYVKNERLGFSVSYFEGGRPRQYFPDFIVATRNGSERWTIAETKGEVWPNTDLKRLAAEKWCRMMTEAGQGSWSYLFVQERAFRRALKTGVATLAALTTAIEGAPALALVPTLISDGDATEEQRFVTLLPVYSLAAAAGYFGAGEHVEQEGWVEVGGKLDESMFVARAVGQSMEPRIGGGDLCVFRAKPAGTRQGKILLVQYQGPADPDTGGAYAVKRYRSDKVMDEATGELVNTLVTLSPENPDYDPIELTPEFEHDVLVIAEFVSVLRTDSA